MIACESAGGLSSRIGDLALNRCDVINRARIWPILSAASLGMMPYAARAAPLPGGPTGLTCTSKAGAIIRINVDLSTRRFQKEGFAAAPLKAVSGNTIILVSAKIANVAVEAMLDRTTLVYTAQSDDLSSKAMTRTEYQCVAGAPFEVAANN
jgi:hypothetical protein